MVVAPSPIRAAHLNPRRAPSFRIVRLIGPMGIESSSPLMIPVSPATKIGGSECMRGQPGAAGPGSASSSSSSSSISRRIRREMCGRINP